MTTSPTLTGTGYAAAYAKGRHAAHERLPETDNPFRRGTPSFEGWKDGYYDEQSARFIAIERHSAYLWNASGSN